MRLPKKPPVIDWHRLLNERPGQVMKLIQAVPGPTVNRRYIHWHKLVYLTPPEGLTHEEWWTGLKFRRQVLYKEIPLTDLAGNSFKYAYVDPPMPQILHKIDLGAGGHIQMPEQVTNPEMRDAYCVSSLIEEAITSSQLEGATTTRPVAKEMIRTNRKPRDKSERMILNNYLAMKEIRKLKSENLTKELVFRIHEIVSQGTLDDQSAAGRFRTAREEVRVEDDYGQVFHTPPPASGLEDRMQKMCEFANSSSMDESFIAPVIRSILLHFWLSYDHPFVDGNGRTARALFYWSMLKHGYWLCEYLSISQVIKKAPSKYGKAFLYTENDENDLTYFLLYHLNLIDRAIEDLHAYIRRKTTELQSIEAELRGMHFFNHRQRLLINHALRHPNQIYTIESHKNSHNVVYQTARTDLLTLVDKGLLTSSKQGKTYRFRPAPDLEARLMQIGQ